MPPKRMSDVLPSSIDARTSSPLPTATTDTSDGPSLPIIGSAHDHASAKGTKRKRASNDAPKPAKAPVTAGNGVRRENTNHASLYEPWVLLPAKQRADVEKQGTDRIEVVVWSKNQNVKSGICRLLRLVGAASEASGEASTKASSNEDRAEDKASGVEDAMVVLSAQGEATVKLIGILDMARRIAGQGMGIREGEGEGVKWFFYTVLGSVQMTRAKRTNGGKEGEGENAEGEDGAMEVDGDVDVDLDESGERGAVKGTQHSGKEETKKVPVLSVWISRKRMVGWKEVFGEQEMVVRRAAN